MSVILSLLGIVLAAAGVAAIGFGIPINEFTLGTTLVLAGTTGLAGGLVLIGLAAVVAELGRITEALKTRPLARPAARPPEAVEPVVPAAPSIVAVPTPGIAASVRPSQASIPSQANVPPRLRHEAPVRDARPIEADTLASPPSTVDASSNAIERLRSSIPRAERPKPSPRWSLTTTMCRCPRTAGTIRHNSPCLRPVKASRPSRKCRRTTARATRLSTC